MKCESSKLFSRLSAVRPVLKVLNPEKPVVPPERKVLIPENPTI